MKKRIFVCCMLLALLANSCGAAWAETEAAYADLNGAVQTQTGVTWIGQDTVLWSSGWYAVSGACTIEDRVTAEGAVNLILCDGASLTALKGIRLAAGSSLTIWAGPDGTGSLSAGTPAKYFAGIGGNEHESAGSLTLNGGSVTATGGEKGAGIGGGNNGNGGTVIVNGGSVTATGGIRAAGIGGGKNGDGGEISVNGGEITATGGIQAAGIGGGENGNAGEFIISGGFVTAKGGTSSAGIGGGYKGSGGTATIKRGVVIATGKMYGAGIGGGYKGSSGEITISGGEVTATGGDGAGIGSGYIGSAFTITISGGFVTATSTYGAGIGSGANSGGGEILISGGEITAVSKYGAGIGGGHDKGCAGTVTISGGFVTATGGLKAAGIGGGKKGDGGKVTISGGNINATGGSQGPGIGTGNQGSAGSITIHDGTVTAVGGKSGAGIGGGYEGSGGTITIYGGAVTAIGTKSGAGIGGGRFGSGGKITISDGEITATGGESAAGIGGGYEGSGGTIVINNGTVTAAGGKNGAGIGGGSLADGGSVTIYRGSVTATGGDYGAGIGGGQRGNGGVLTVYQGEIIAVGGLSGGAGIGGGGAQKAGTGNSNGGAVTIYGGTVTATGGGAAAGIGGGDSSGTTNGKGGVVTVYGGTVTATGGLTGGAGIGGGGRFGNKGTLIVNGGTVIAATGDPENNQLVSIGDGGKRNYASTGKLILPQEGYTLESLTVKDRNGNEIPVTEDRYARFDIPRAYVMITAASSYTGETENLPGYYVSLCADPWDGGELTGAGEWPAYGSVTVKAEAREGYVFSHWTEDEATVSTDAEFVFPALYDRVLTAHFLPIGLALVENGEGGGYYLEGEEVEISADEAAEGYAFDHWEGAEFADAFSPSTTFAMPAGNVTVSAVYRQLTYGVTAAGINGTVTADRETAALGDIVTLTLAPEERHHLDQLTVMCDTEEVETIKQSETTYTFTMPAGDVRVNAVFVEGETPYYIAAFEDWNGSWLEYGIYEEGELPEYKGETPVREPNEMYSFTFSRWEPKVEPLKANAYYTAVYTMTPRSYTVRFVNWDGAELQSEEYLYGDTPEYTGISPERPDDEKGVYLFKGWTRAIQAVTGECTYTADYTLIPALSQGDNTVYVQRYAKNTFVFRTPQGGAGNYRFWSTGTTTPYITIYTESGEQVAYDSWSGEGGNFDCFPWLDGDTAYTVVLSDYRTSANVDVHIQKTDVYSIDLIDSDPNGYLTCSLDEAYPGRWVYVLAESERGIEARELIVTAADGSPVEIEGACFLMPASDVSVDVRFVRVHAIETRCGEQVILNAVSADEIEFFAGEGARAASGDKAALCFFVDDQDAFVPGEIAVTSASGQSIPCWLEKEWDEEYIVYFLRFIMPDEPVTAAVSCMDAVFGAPDFTLPENLREIQAEAFAGAAMGVVAVPAGCVSIGEGAFRNCINLHKISVPENCALGDDVFAGCGLVYVYGVNGSYADAYCQTHENCFFIPMK